MKAIGIKDEPQDTRGDRKSKQQRLHYWQVGHISINDLAVSKQHPRLKIFNDKILISTWAQLMAPTGLNVNVWLQFKRVMYRSNS